jgi:hypothetical protein
MTYFFFVSLPLLMGIGLVGLWLRMMPVVVAVAFPIFFTTWLFG